MKKKFSVLMLILIGLSACNLPLWKTGSKTPVPRSAQTTVTLTASVTVTPTSELDSYVDTMCAFNWATKSLPKESALLQAAMRDAGILFITAFAEAFGEDCVTANNENLGFTTMETDFRFAFLVDNLVNTQQMGEVIYKVINLILDFPPDTFPGPKPGYIGIRFTDGNNDLNLWFLIDTAKNAIDQGKMGAELFQELNH